MPEELKEFQDWKDSADHFMVDFSSRIFKSMSSVLFNPKEQITFYRGSDGKLHINVDSQSTPKFAFDLCTEGLKLETGFSDYSAGLEEFGRFTFFQDDETSTTFNFWRKANG